MIDKQELLELILATHWHDTWKDSLCDFMAYVDLALQANKKRGKIMLRGNFVEVDDRELITSLRDLQKRWRWGSVGKVKRFLEMLDREGYIKVEHDQSMTRIKINKQGGEERE